MNFQEKKDWKKVKFNQRFLNAFRGIYVFLRTTCHFFYIHIPIYLVMIFLGVCFKISEAEWLAIVFSIGLMFISEAFNTAIEIDIDLTSPEFHPYARDTKDVAAGAVLISVFMAIIIGLIIFFPLIFTKILFYVRM